MVDALTGRAGESLEVAVEALFSSAGFQTRRATKTNAGEMDVLAEYKDYDVAVECKHYSTDGTAIITRDVISNISRKTELLGRRNAVLVVTKPPSAELMNFAREISVIVRTYDDIARMKRQMQQMDLDLHKRAAYLIREFSLIEKATDVQLQKRREFMHDFAAGRVTRRALTAALVDALHRHWKPLFAAIALVVIAMAGAAYLVPAVAQALKTLAFTIVALAILAGMWVYAGRSEKRKGGPRRSRPR